MNRLILSAFLILLAGSIYYCLERMLFCDASFILARIVTEQRLQIQEQRYGSFITQSVPLLAAKLGLPFKVIVYLYSAAFNLLYLAVAAFLLKLRQQRLALLFLLYFLLFSTASYYWTNNEVHQGIAWMFLYLGGVQWKRQKPMAGWKNWGLTAVLGLLAALSIFTHLLVVFPILFLTGFLLLEEGRKPHTGWLWLPFLLALALAKYYSSTHTGYYDTVKLEGMRQVGMADLPGVLGRPVLKDLAWRMVHEYWLILLVAAAGTITMLIQRRWLQLVGLLASVGAYLLAYALTFDNFTRFYSESELMSLSILLATPFVYCLLPRLRRGQAVVLVGLISVICLVRIGQAGRKFTQRKNWVIGQVTRMRAAGLTKGIVAETEENRRLLIEHWAAPSESMVASAFFGDSVTRSFVVVPAERTQELANTSKEQVWITKDFPVEAARINGRYFRVDTTVGYRIISAER